MNRKKVSEIPYECFFPDTTSRVIQTMPTKSSYQQTDMEKGTQTATSGFHVCTGDDKEVTGSGFYISLFLSLRAIFIF